jgi:hypothetical protein
MMVAGSLSKRRECQRFRHGIGRAVIVLPGELHLGLGLASAPIEQGEIGVPGEMPLQAEEGGSGTLERA